MPIASSGCSRAWNARSTSNSLDSQPVDIIFGLIAPESAGADHLKALASIARVLRNPATVAKMRSTREPSALYSLLIHPGRASDAA